MSGEPSTWLPGAELTADALRVAAPATFNVSIEPLPATCVSSAIEIGAPGVVSLRIPALRTKVHSFQFAPVDEPAAPDTTANTTAPATSAVCGPPPSAPSLSMAGHQVTRIRPPGDCIKLADRLFYLLQPPLESILASRALDFPAHPFPYQLQGVAFLYPRESALLADEMGLGKTMQAITAIRLLICAGELRRVLLVCPKPLVSNWVREFARWAPEIPVCAIEGDATRRRFQWELAEMPLKIANYELLQRDRDLVVDNPQPYDLVLLDESQRIKNRSSTTAEIVRAIPRRRSWALTGTPVENSADDLVGIFEFLAPGYLRSDMKPRRMGKLAADYVLRRTKDQVLDDLPPKLFRDADVELSSAQRESYRLAEEEGVLRLTELGEGATIQHVFELVLRLKQICNFDPATGESSKFERLAADLDEVASSGRKAIVFSQWVETIETLAERLGDYGVLQFHGRIASRNRDQVLHDFQHNPDKHVLLMSYGAGSVGLNLQFASYVFLFDRWWNPAVEDQAINRAHRIGATGPVTVTRFLAMNTIEQRIDQVLQEKRELFDTIFSDASTPHSLGLTQAEIFGLFQLKGPAGPIRVAG